MLAGQEVPEEERYDGYLQLENGVGMLRLLFEEFTEGYKSLTGDERQEELSDCHRKAGISLYKRHGGKDRREIS